MIRKIDHNKMGASDLGWLKSIFHFSFSDYYNPNNMEFGALRVLNDDLINPGTGFDTHPHKNMEIISYVVKGELTHKDSMGNESKLYRGHIQYMSAGTGVEHSEFNHSKPILRILQLWIKPDQLGYEPVYGEHRFNWNDRKNTLLPLFSGKNGSAPVKINQDVNGFAIDLERRQKLNLEVLEGRQAYIVQIEGSSLINGITLNQRDAIEIIEENVLIKSLGDAHLLILDMKKS
jgi:quercetin 2,3-dioxygenase